jgi:hypothetical protein
MGAVKQSVGDGVSDRGVAEVGQPERLARAHAAAGRVHVMLLVAQSWAYVPADDLADAQDTASRLEKLTAPA